MRERRFALQSLPSAGPRPGVRITGEVVRRGEVLTISFLLQGQLAEVRIPAPLAGPARRDRLWEETCFEFFLGVPGLPQYREFNLSPAGSWNVYHFSSYRQGMGADLAFVRLPFDVQNRPDSLQLIAAVDLAGIVPPERSLEVAVAAVIQGRKGEKTYWALVHPGPQADFHRRDSFLITL